MERFNTEINSWEMVKDMNNRRWGPGVSIFHKQIVVLGGGRERAGCAEVYNEKDESWAVMTSKLPPGYGFLSFFPSANTMCYRACTVKKPWDLTGSCPNFKK